MAEVLSVLILLQSFAVVIGWVLFVIAAYCRGRDVAGFLMLGIFTGFFALLFVLIIPPNKEVLAKHAIDKGQMKRCDDCKELVNISAQKCPHCATHLLLEYVDNNN